MSDGFTVAKNPARQRARQRILAEANAHRNAIGRAVGTFYMKHLNEAVCIVRRRGLVKDSVLITAGFNARQVPQGRRASGSPLSPPGGDRTAVEMSGQPPPASGRSARRRASAATDPQARERAPLATSVRTRRAKTRAGAAGAATGPRPGNPA